MSKWIQQFSISGILTAGLLSTAIAADPLTVEHTARAGAEGRIDAAPCIAITAPPAFGNARIATLQDKTEVLLYTPAEKQTAAVVIRVDTGETAKVQDKCPNPTTKDKNHVIQVRGEPEVPPEALDKAFRLLVATFVLALLLESAFELLFNWRLFQAFFVGRAWRTPIMFAISLAVVRSFDLDLMAALFNAYHGGSGGLRAGSWVTSCLTAMIVSGGSVGVNKILIALRFRSQLPKLEQETPALAPDEAWISVEVRGASADDQYRLDITTVPCVDTPETLAILRAPGPGRLRQLLFPSSFRTPPSGGRRVRADVCYRITVTDRLGRAYDLNGKLLTAAGQAAPVRFAPRAVVDFVIMPQPK